MFWWPALVWTGLRAQGRTLRHHDPDPTIRSMKGRVTSEDGGMGRRGEPGTLNKWTVTPGVSQVL